MEHKLFKYGEAIAFDESAIHSSDSVLSDPEIVSRFQKLATGLKRIAPKANDFLYFSAVMMHAAEASTVDHNGSPKKLANGQPVAASWEKKGESVRWVCNDPTINPYRNSNGDIFPEAELLKAYKKWVGKPLCIDHKSSSVDFVRGVIIDTYYDRIGKRVIALCALDKISFPELARKVATGVSTCVSMGTAVGRAVCTDCGTVARTEHDFCNHMRTKSCYGEINLDLQPIELSIVVTGADPQAKIREILASANHLNRRAEEAEQQLNALSAEETTTRGSSIRTVVSNIKEGLDALIREFEGSSEAVEDVTETTEPVMTAVASEQNDDSSAENSSEEANITESVVTASDESTALKDKFNSLRDAIQQKISKIEEDFNTLFTLGDGLRDNTMEKKSYFQGAGDVNEPTPGQPKYEKDPLAEKTRNTEDRQMTGIVNTGPVDGLFPGDSEKKKLLLRASRRDAAVLKAKARLESNAYFQGTEEPTLGKPQYKKEEADSIRDKADKQMTGQAPFPGVGKVDGLHPSPESVTVKDELKRKELLQRASLKAKFVKAMDQADSQWQVFAGDKLVYAASVKDLNSTYEKVATKAFGLSLIANIRENGLTKAAQMPEIPAAPMGDPSAMPPAAPMGAEPASAEAAVEQADEGGVGSPADTVSGMAKDAKEMSETLEELANTMKEEEPSAEGLEGLAPATASLQKMRIKLHAALLAGVQKVASDLNEQIEELALYSADDLTPENQETIAAMAQDCVEETKVSLAEANELLASFVNYVKGTENVQKQASREVEMKKLAEESAMEGKLDELLAEMEAEEEAPATEKDLAPLFEDEVPAEVELLDAADATPMAADAEDDALLSLDSNDANVEMKPEDLSKLPSNAKVEVKMAEFDLSTREGRAAYRMKLAGDATKMNPILEESAKLQDNSHDGTAKVETIKEKHDAIYDVATAPPKVRKDAEELLALVKAGKLSADEVDALVSHGLDADAAKYFKQLWKDVDGGSEFASQLVKEHAQAKLDEAMSTYKVKIARAYDLAYQMVERGLCSRDAQVLSAQADEIMKYNDAAFESLKNVVAKHAPLALNKQASRLPNVGFLGTEETPAKEESGDLLSDLNRAFSGRNGRY